MLDRKNRTMDRYVRAGASMRLLKETLNNAMLEASPVLSAKDTDMLYRYGIRIGMLCSRAEDNMLKDYPDMGREFSDVFFGAVNDTPSTDMDKDVMAKAKEMADGLFERKTD